VSISQDMTFEKALARLEKIVERMDSGEPSLEEALELFSEGTELAQYCSSVIEDAEGKLEALVEAKDGKNEVIPFEACDSDENYKEDD
jgi:exodeoxyribonuclease VII small subunit